MRAKPIVSFKGFMFAAHVASGRELFNTCAEYNKVD